ncbi:MAG: hypothetical protein E7256_15880 [Lachnospiraceae bacterium]|nr:hypothetical protein [Lachnospiraceae bacterium]
MVKEIGAAKDMGEAYIVLGMMIRNGKENVLFSWAFHFLTFTESKKVGKSKKNEEMGGRGGGMLV